MAFLGDCLKKGLYMVTDGRIFWILAEGARFQNLRVSGRFRTRRLMGIVKTWSKIPAQRSPAFLYSDS